jgi:DNA-directed RNA polymerase subunit alpha
MSVEPRDDSPRPSPLSVLLGTAPAAPVRPAGPSIKMADLELSARSRKALERLGIETIDDLAKLTEEKLLACKNFGETSLNEVKQLLRRYNLSLAG